MRDDDEPWSHSELVDAARNADAIVSLLTDKIDEEVLQAGAEGRLKVVANAAVGYDNIDLKSAMRFHIAVCNTPGVLDETTADLAFLLILAASRLAYEAASDLRSGQWAGWGINQYLGRDVHGALLGLVGYGRIARAVADRARGFGCEVIHHARHDTGLPGFISDLASLLGRSDIVSLHVPLTDDTYHLIGRDEIALMKQGSVLVNTSRGQVVDEQALAEALLQGRIFGVGLDVYENEPSVNPLLLKSPRAVLLPHIGSATRATRTTMARMACQAVCDVLEGRTPDNLVRSEN